MSENPPRHDNSRKWYMQLMKNMWDDLNYHHLAMSSQNLRDHVAVLERSLGDTAGDIFSRVARTERRDQERESEVNSCHNTSDNTSENANELQPTQMANLHTETIEDQLSPSTNT